MKFNNLENRIETLDERINELEDKKRVLVKEKEFRQYLSTWKDSRDDSIEGLLGGYFMIRSRKELRRDNIEWFVKYKKDESKYSEAVKDMKRLLNLLESDEIKLSKARELKRTLEEYGFDLFFTSEDSYTKECDFCNYEAVGRDAELSLTLYKTTGTVYDHGIRRSHNVSLIYDEPLKTMKEYELKVRKEDLEDYTEDLKKEWNNMIKEAETVKESEESLNSLKNELSPVEEIEENDYTIPIRGVYHLICEDCVNKESIKDEVFSLNSFEFVEEDWTYVKLE